MKFFVAFSLAFLASVHCVPSHGGIVNTGSSAVTRSEDGYGNYAFGYNEDHATGGSFRKEKGGPGVQVGSYGLRDADGRMRVVSYVADAHGFRASVSTNEPGTDPKQDPAAMDINGPHGAIVAPAPIAAAPIVAKSYAAPAAYAAPAIAAHAAPITTSTYSISTQHISAAPAAYAAPAIAAHVAPAIAAHAAPIAKAAIAAPAIASYSAPIAASYQTSTAHIAAAPIIAKSYAAPAIAAPAPIITKSYAAPAIAAPAPIIAKSYAAPAIAAPIAPIAKAIAPAPLAATYSIHTLGGGYSKAY